MSLRNNPVRATLRSWLHPVIRTGAMDASDGGDVRRAAKFCNDSLSRLHGYECSDYRYIVNYFCSDFSNRLLVAENATLFR